MPKKGVTGVTIKTEYFEEEAASPLITKSITLNHNSAQYDLGNYSINGIEVFLVDNETVTEVEPGNRIWQGIYIQIPPGLSLPVEVI